MQQFILEIHLTFGFEWTAMASVLSRHHAQTYMRSLPAFAFTDFNEYLSRNEVMSNFTHYFEKTAHHKDTLVFTLFEVGFVLDSFREVSLSM